MMIHCMRSFVTPSFPFQGYESSVPVFFNLSDLPKDAAVSPPIMSSRIHMAIEVDSSGLAGFLCPSDGHVTAGNQVYITGGVAMLQIRNFQKVRRKLRWCMWRYWFEHWGSEGGIVLRF